MEGYMMKEEKLHVNKLIEEEIESTQAPENVKNVARDVFIFECENWNKESPQFNKEFDTIIRQNLKKEKG
jgi:predicted NAD-dependent protein-ADP-ribosyltransferase YbiA (DUF1768 family)